MKNIKNIISLMNSTAAESQLLVISHLGSKHYNNSIHHHYDFSWCNCTFLQEN